MSKQGTDRERYFAEREDDLLALAAELVDTGHRLAGVAAHLNGVALCRVPVSDASVREARLLGAQAVARLAARRKRAA